MAKTKSTDEDRMQWAWEHAAEAYEERDLLIAALARVYPSHLMHSTRGVRSTQKVICIHTPAGQLAWTLPNPAKDDDVDQVNAGTLVDAVKDLAVTASDWDGAKTADRLERLRRLAHGNVASVKTK